MKNSAFVVLVLTTVLLLDEVWSKVTVTIALGTFTASVRCDFFQPCDFKFIVCVDDTLLTSGSRMSPCTYASRSTGRLGPSPIQLTTKFPSIVTQINNWRGLRLKVKVLDHDQFSQDDEVDFLSTSYLGPIGKRLITTMSSRTRLTVTFTSVCSPNYYGNNCERYCYPQNSQMFGHYTCQPMTGFKICHPGWKGINCNEPVTTAAPSTTTMTTNIDLETTDESLITSTIDKEETSDNETKFHIVQMKTNIALSGFEKSHTDQSEDSSEGFADPQHWSTAVYESDESLNSDMDDSFKKGPSLHKDHNSTEEEEDTYFKHFLGDPVTMNFDFDYLNNTKAWFCGKLNLVSREENPTLNKEILNLNKISEFENSLKSSGNVSLTVSLDHQIECNGSLVDAYLINYCWNTMLNRSEMEHVIKEKFSEVFGQLFQPLHREFCFSFSKDSTTEIMYSIWGSLLVVIVLVAIAGFFIYRKKKRCHTISTDSKFMFQFKKGNASVNNQQQSSKAADDKINIFQDNYKNV